MADADLRLAARVRCPAGRRSGDHPDHRGGSDNIVSSLAEPMPGSDPHLHGDVIQGRACVSPDLRRIAEAIVLGHERRQILWK